MILLDQIENADDENKPEVTEVTDDKDTIGKHTDGELLDYENFKEEMRLRLIARFPNRAVDIHTIRKPNRPLLHGVTVVSDGDMVSPLIYLNDYYIRYCSGERMDSLFECMIKAMKEAECRLEFDVSSLRNFEYVKDRIVFKLINYEQNKDMLADMPHRRFLDLALVYYFIIRDEEIGTATAHIFNSHMKLWGTDEADLFAIAKVNTPKLLGYELKTMDYMMNELVLEQMRDQFADEDDFEEFKACTLKEEDENPRNPMFVLTNSDRFNGAACILYSEVLEDFARTQGGDIYVLPSSIHEVILIPCDVAPEREELEDMVREINCHEVDVADRLSDNVYRYSLKDGAISI